MKLFVVIANYGRKNDIYLSRVLSEYRSMDYHVDIVVLSNLDKDLGPDVEVVVGLPQKNPWSMPFGHKRLFAERQDSYDLFLYAEDDMLVTQKNIEAFLRATSILPKTRIAGFFQRERYPDGRAYYPAVHSHFHWVPGSVTVFGDYTFARFTNDHSACYLLSKSQLKDAIASGGFLVDPHENQDDLLVTAATDPYTQCGFTKLLCVSHFEDFIVSHLPNKYAGTGMGLDGSEFSKQMQALLLYSGNGRMQTQLLKPETKLFHRSWSKNYYEPCRHDLIELLPTNARTVLSIGCGFGATEGELVNRGMQVMAVPLDGVIAACAESRGVKMIFGDLDKALGQLAGQQFDAILMSGILHLMPDPASTLSKVSPLLSKNGSIVASVPNLNRLPVLWERLRYPSRYRGLKKFDRSGVHAIGRRRMMGWFRKAGLQTATLVEKVPSSWKRAVSMSGDLAKPLFSSEYIVCGRKK
jgi:2-polyprenyl-3-methyl-5-hydroxy-6-metoxy-1,4-benzoquinol methylase